MEVFKDWILIFLNDSVFLHFRAIKCIKMGLNPVFNTLMQKTIEDRDLLRLKISLWVKTSKCLGFI